MNKLNELIHKLCPNGVEYYPLGDICNLVTGATPSKTKKEYWENGTISWMSSGEVNNRYVFGTENKITQLGYDSTSTTIVPIHSVVIALAGQGKTRGKVAITEIELCTNQSLCSIICGERVYYKFLFHYLESKYLELRAISNGDGARGGLSLRILAPYKIPVPPLEVQEEIVHILDRFSENTIELTAKLTTELVARKKQYEYCREAVLDKNENIAWVPLLEVADTFTGLTYKPSDVAQTGTLVLRSSNIQDRKLVFDDNIYVQMDCIPQRSLVQEDDILICVRNGSKALIGKAAMIPKHSHPMAFGAFMTILRAKKQVNSKYLFFVWQSPRIQNMIHGESGMPINQITKKMLEQIVVPLPTLEEQQKAVEVLEEIDSVYNGISTAVLAEIEARQKQYEYYRDKLLTFKPLP